MSEAVMELLRSMALEVSRNRGEVKMENDIKEFLLKEYEGCRDLIKFNMELHQNLMKFFISILSFISAVIGGIYKFGPVNGGTKISFFEFAQKLLPLFYFIAYPVFSLIPFAYSFYNVIRN